MSLELAEEKQEEAAPAKPTELDLAERLVELMQVRTIIADETAKAREALNTAAKRGEEVEAEIEAIKHQLGKSTRKRRKRSRPTPAASSDGSSHAPTIGEIRKVMGDEWRRTGEVATLVGATSKADRQYISNTIRRLWKRGELERRPSGKKTNVGLPIYEYRSVKST